MKISLFQPPENLLKPLLPPARYSSVRPAPATSIRPTLRPRPTRVIYSHTHNNDYFKKKRSKQSSLRGRPRSADGRGSIFRGVLYYHDRVL